MARGEPAEAVRELRVARPVGDVLVLVAGERVRARRRDCRALLARDSAEPAAQIDEIVDRLLDVHRDPRRGLDDRLQQLRLDALLDRLAVGDASEDRLDARDELERRRVYELELFLEAEAVRRARAEARFHDVIPGTTPLRTPSRAAARAGRTRRSRRASPRSHEMRRAPSSGVSCRLSTAARIFVTRSSAACHFGSMLFSNSSGVIDA